MEQDIGELISRMEGGVECTESSTLHDTWTAFKRALVEEVKSAAESTDYYARTLEGVFADLAVSIARLKSERDKLQDQVGRMVDREREILAFINPPDHPDAAYLFEGNECFTRWKKIVDEMREDSR